MSKREDEKESWEEGERERQHDPSQGSVIDHCLTVSNYWPTTVFRDFLCILSLFPLAQSETC